VSKKKTWANPMMEGRVKVHNSKKRGDRPHSTLGVPNRSEAVNKSLIGGNGEKNIIKTRKCCDANWFTPS